MKESGAGRISFLAQRHSNEYSVTAGLQCSANLNFRLYCIWTFATSQSLVGFLWRWMPWHDWSGHVFTFVMLETHKNLKTLVLNDNEPQIFSLYSSIPWCEGCHLGLFVVMGWRTACCSFDARDFLNSCSLRGTPFYHQIFSQGFTSTSVNRPSTVGEKKVVRSQEEKKNIFNTFFSNSPLAPLRSPSTLVLTVKSLWKGGDRINSQGFEQEHIIIYMHDHRFTAP